MTPRHGLTIVSRPFIEFCRSAWRREAPEGTRMLRTDLPTTPQLVFTSLPSWLQRVWNEPSRSSRR